MNVADISIGDIVVLIFKVFVAIIIIFGVIGCIGAIGNFFKEIGKLLEAALSHLLPPIFKGFWRFLIYIGFRDSFWNLIPLLLVFIELFAAILSFVFPHPNSPNFWPWWKYALPGVLVFGVTLAINVGIRKYQTQKDAPSKLRGIPSDNFLIEEGPIEVTDIGGSEDSKFAGGSNLYCYQCTKKLGLVSKEHRGRYYCDACYLNWADSKKK